MTNWRGLVVGLATAFGGSVGLAQYQSLHDQNGHAAAAVLHFTLIHEPMRR